MIIYRTALRWSSVAAGVLFLAGSFAARVGAQTSDAPLVHGDYSRNKTVTTFDELERTGNTSKISVVQDTRSSVGSSLFVGQAFYEIAKARHCEYFFNLDEWSDKGGARIYVAGFTNEKNADIKREFGSQYSYENESGQKRHALSVSQFAPLYEQMKVQRALPSPSADVSPTH